eukprot:scpid38822/ scgid19053/ 
MEKIKETLIEFFAIDVMRVLADVLLSPLAEGGHDGRSVLEKWLRDHDIAKQDDLYLLETLRCWQREMLLGSRYMLFQAIKTALLRVDKERAIPMGICTLLLGPWPPVADLA